MEQRMNLQQLQPDAYKALFGLERYLAATALKPVHRELVKLRASALNGCAYCIEMHTGEALKLGITPQRIALLAAWEESAAFDDDEKAVLALTDHVTRLSELNVPDAVWARVRARFDDTYTAQLIMAIIAINAWNRIGVATRMVFEG